MLDIDDLAEVIADAVRPLSQRIAILEQRKSATPEKGDNGVGLADALIDSEGHLVLTMSDGRTKTLGVVVGNDGAAGLGFDDFEVEQVDGRVVRFLLRRADREAEFDIRFPVPIYRGVFKEGETYESGDLTTWAGSLWHCNEVKDLKPGSPDSGWQLAAKAGRPGKDAGK